jgi:GNAT superfamily N-acetyltransferase
MPLLVRAKTDDDAPVVRQIRDAAFAALRSIYRPSPKAHANLAIISSTLERLVAVEGERIVGTVSFAMSDERLRVIALAVLPEMQRRGVARALINRLQAIAKSRKCRILSLYTVAETGNVPIFERLGFRLVSQQPDTFSISPTSQPLTEALMELNFD